MSNQQQSLLEEPKRRDAAERRRREAIEQLAADLISYQTPQSLIESLHRCVWHFHDNVPKPFTFVDGNKLIGQIGVKYVPGEHCDIFAPQPEP